VDEIMLHRLLGREREERQWQHGEEPSDTIDEPIDQQPKSGRAFALYKELPSEQRNGDEEEWQAPVQSHAELRGRTIQLMRPQAEPGYGESKENPE
jgi:hypothetical protein